MSDFGRKDLTEQVHDKVKPDSQKSYLEQAGDALSGAYDRVAAAVVPAENKSTSQSAADSLRGTNDDAKAEGNSLYDTVASGLTNVKDSLGLGSDTGRKSWTTEAKEELTPESQKSYLDKAKEGVTDTADKLAGGLQTDDSKSAGQATFDKLRREKDSA
ncbi:hypothetical protein G7K_2005-t1 [Saitoella complicata NRRL Y-17804]|uniref:Uncharacterized protein n=3 Tax=Saitoella complicata (strain BCRC 22490 / CBS 7301 / JCM 7358 / NBRC 10748 / NRRL Y-17804) TaxID=698492 RepID=A0A0E9ND75_SAICN|nr:hypothetical protein G7K_2005-t1 [Saitoella complicata NRRL Y-17804]